MANLENRKNPDLADLDRIFPSLTLSFLIRFWWNWYQTTLFWGQEVHFRSQNCKFVTLVAYSSAYPFSRKIFPFGENFSFSWNIFLLVKNFPQNVRAMKNFPRNVRTRKIFPHFSRKIFHQKEIFSPKGKYFTKRKFVHQKENISPKGKIFLEKDKQMNTLLVSYNS